MKHVFFVVCTAIALAVGVARCGGGMSDVRNRAQGSACETSCQEGRDKCATECAQKVTKGESTDSTACNLACDEARDRCNTDCKSR